mmetsp:Transcript_10037/g.40541  ORF Transcript_10037/g.40541 Transcript_10037/m.40541 type:complete len:239 (+) Transcript_10037:1674-2390(+)
MAGQDADPRGDQVRGVRQGRAGDVPHARPVRHLPPVHVQPPPVSVFADGEQHPGRDRVLPADDGTGDGAELAHHDTTDADVVHVQRSAHAGAAGRRVHPARLHPPAGHVLHDCRSRGLHDRGVAKGELPGPARARGLPQPARAARGGRGDGDGRAVSHPEAGGVRPRRLSGAVPPREAQPQRHAQHERRVDAELRPRRGRRQRRVRRRGRRGGDHIHGRHLHERVPAAPRQARRAGVI